ncbi:meiotic recombination protein REC114 isoform X3 [Hypanus sabinus]|uniref:meiotic recombination protein REC114 isoform X3 n=1 Tax=Hypanus sabinus TaxID=79690 RepID=UPI0028C4075E|nr:meiotic recombination protein REC114 isoform X3 [Hypanus sabinus]
MAALRSTTGAAGGGEALPSTQWSLKRYARFLASGGAPNSWEVFESSPEKGFLSLNIVQSGHFLISQGGTTLLEGFSLIEAHKWWKAVRRADCVLFGSKVKAQDTEKGQSQMQSILSDHRMSIKQVAKSMLGDKSFNLPLAYQHSALNTEELGPFLKLCLMDQSFPAFVEQVEQELKKLIEE